ncbi:MAG: hypothetical protein GX455_11730 [Phycisphaerae bacterium]|nr:hypothetical protein [Phycisphaerae bacterium]
MIFGKIRNSSDKLFLLAIFAAGLGIAQYLVVVRSRIELSPPVVLPEEGLSIRLPVSVGWQSQSKWTFDPREGGSYILAQFAVPSHQANLFCGIRPYSETDGTIQERLTRRAAFHKAQIVQVGERKLRNIQMNWVLAVREQSTFGMFYGVGMAGDDQVIELEVTSPTDADLARRIFMTVADGLRYKPKPPPPDPKNVAKRLNESSGAGELVLAAGSSN